ncbi:hypothetical protein LJC45_03570 [Alistipes sp. OttesenSCG-928-B03]|nr:hypothetical protein [Alistipes sp. OttesenSCG-928-B03]
MERIIRVFPRKTNATPDDDLVRVKALPMASDEADQVHISVAFTWDIPWAEQAAEQWRHVAPVKVGGPAYNEPGGDFVPGMYMKKGYVITSRGCPNRCWFCSVPKREGYRLRELPVTEGWNIADDNLLACSPEHIDQVFGMLSRQRERIKFTGGLEAALLTPEMAGRLRSLKPKTLYFAYDTPNDLRPLQEAGKMLLEAGFTKASSVLQCYVLTGFKGDTQEKALKRMGEAWDAGFLPMSMLYRDELGLKPEGWSTFHWQWARPHIRASNCKKLFG